MCTACSAFDKYMKNSKEYMVEGEYEKAVEQLNLAIIENPTDKNAAALLETAEKNLKEKNEKEIKQHFSDVSQDVTAFIKEKMTPIDVDTITIDEAKEILPEAKLKYKEAKELFDEYNLINSSYATATESLFQIYDNSVELLENIIENVVEPLPTIPPNSTRLFRLTSRTESNDSRIKASFNKSTIETFISEFDLYYVSIMRQEE